MVHIVQRPMLISAMRLAVHYNEQVRIFKQMYMARTIHGVFGNFRQVHSTIDVTEVEKFSWAIKEWWDPKGKWKILHAMNKVRVPFVRDGMLQNSFDIDSEMPLKEKKILDVGCGGGILSEALAEIGAKVTGIDVSEELIKIAKQHENPILVKNKPTYYYTAIEDHVQNFNNYYDGIVASEVIEHVANPELFIKSCVSALKTGGKIFITTPNRTWYCWFVGIYLAENVFGIIPKGLHEYKSLIKPEELTKMLEKYNCKKESICGFNYRPFKEDWSREKSLKFIYALKATKLN